MDPAVASLARALAGILALGHEGDTADVEALSTLLQVHWIRFQVLPEGQDQEDLLACVTWSAALLPIAPGRVPDRLRSALTAAGAGVDAVGNIAADANNRAITLIKGYEETGNLEDLRIP
jgi:hypothetical protein